MKTVVLIADCSAKKSQAARASDMFTSPMFRASLTYARSLEPDAIYILSVKYGLVGLDETILPYHASSITRDVAGKDVWSDKVLHKLRTVANLEKDRFVILAGRRYRDGLMSFISHAETPMEGMSTAHQLNFLRRNSSSVGERKHSEGRPR